MREVCHAPFSSKVGLARVVSGQPRPSKNRETFWTESMLASDFSLFLMFRSTTDILWFYILMMKLLNASKVCSLYFISSTIQPEEAGGELGSPHIIIHSTCFLFFSKHIHIMMPSVPCFIVEMSCLRWPFHFLSQKAWTFWYYLIRASSFMCVI